MTEQTTTYQVTAKFSAILDGLFEVSDTATVTVTVTGKPTRTAIRQAATEAITTVRLSDVNITSFTFELDAIEDGA